MTGLWSLVKLCVVCLPAVAIQPQGEAAEGNDDLSATDEALLRGELALEASVESADADGHSRLVIPDFDRLVGDSRLTADLTPPVVDGRLEDSFWAQSTAFFWSHVGDSRFRMPFSWRIQAALLDQALYLAGESRGAFFGEGMLSLEGSWRERLVIHFGANDSLARAEATGSTAPVEEYGMTFAATVDARACRWEIRIPKGNELWPLPLSALRPLRFTASRGRPGELFVSPQFQLIPASVALRVGPIDVDRYRRLQMSVTMVNFSKSDLVVRRGLTEEIKLAAGRAQEIGFTSPYLVGTAGQGWDFRVGALANRIGVATAFVGAEEIRDQTERVLQLCRDNLRRTRENSTELDRSLETLQNRLENTTDLDELEVSYLNARLLRRQSFFLSLSSELDRVLFVKRFHYRYGPFYTTYLHDMPGGALCVWSIRQRRLTNVFNPSEGESVRDPYLHPDGGRVVFSVRQHGGGTHLHEIELDGKNHRQLTGGEYHDLDPCYLPDDRIVFTSTRHGASSPINLTVNHCLHLLESDEQGGRSIRRLSFNNLVDFTPTVLEDGRILFLRWSHEDRPGNFINALWTIYPDGRGLSGFFGMNRAGVSIEPQPIPQSDEIVCLSSGPNGHWRSPQVGDIAIVDFRSNQNEFVDEIKAERGGFKTPYPVGDGAFLVSYGWVDTRWGVYLVDRSGNRELVYRDPELSCFDPIWVQPRQPPNKIARLTSTDPTTPARILVQDVYQGLPDVPRGTVKELRVLEVGDRPSIDAKEPFLDQVVPVAFAQRMPRRELGTVPVSPDGSVFFRVPANKNVFFQLLDAYGYLVQTMRDTVHFAAGEHRSCIGCHEPLGFAPARQSAAGLEALKRSPARLQLEGRTPTIRFPRDIQPILDRHCLSCHDASQPAGGVILSGDLTPFFSLAYETLVSGGDNYNNQYWGDSPVTDNAALAPSIQYVTSLLPPRSTGSSVSPLLRLVKSHYGVKLRPTEERALARWIDFNLPYYDGWESEETRLRDKGSSRRLLSARTEKVIQSVLRARCRGCHLRPDLFRGAAVSISRPHLSPILQAPLPKVEGGTGLCRKPVFTNREDPGYRLILGALEEDRRRMTNEDGG